ncbi:unnamed protein product, partial [Mesorhabditis spiculigera]
MRVLVYGGRGALGGSIVDHFKAKNATVVNVDLHANEKADENIALDLSQDWTAQEAAVLAKLDGHFDGVFCVAGGWAGGNAAADDMVKNADLMWKQSVWSSAIAARIAAKHLKEGGLLQLTGAAPALGGTPGMMGYGMAKAAVQQLTKSLAEDGSGLPKGASVVALLPVTLDTPMNRKWMPKADFGTWTPLAWIAEHLEKWTTDAASRPSNGALLKIVTEGGKTTTTEH